MRQNWKTDDEYRAEGGDTWLNGRGWSANPYPQGSNANLLWSDGYHDAAGQEPLADWERALRSDDNEIGVGSVVFSLTDGRTHRIDGVRVDSVGPSADSPGVIGVEFPHSSRVVHVPFVLSWEFDY